MTTDFKLNADGDLDMSNGGIELVTGDDATEQELTQRYKSVQGEWYLDLEEGLPYFSRIFVNAPNLADIYQIYHAETLDAEDIVKVQKLFFTEEDNGLRINVRALTRTGVITISQGI